MYYAYYQVHSLAAAAGIAKCETFGNEFFRWCQLNFGLGLVPVTGIISYHKTIAVQKMNIPLLI